MWILPQPPFRLWNADLTQQLQRAGVGLRTAHAFVQAQAFGQLPANREHWVQCGHRLLEDHPDFIAANAAHVGRRGLRQINLVPLRAIKEQLAIGDLATAVLNKPHQGQRRDGFAGPRFAHHADGLTWVDVETDVLNPHNRPIFGLKFNPQALNLRNGCGGCLIKHEVPCRHCLSVTKATLGPKTTQVKPSCLFLWQFSRFAINRLAI